MSSLKDRLLHDMKAALRAQQAATLLTLRGVLAALQQKEIDERIVMDDAAVVALLDKLVKQRKDAIVQFAAGGRQDLVDRETAELQLLQTYLPPRLDEAAIDDEIRALVAELQAQGPGDLGRVMGAAKTRLAGRAEMARVSAAVKKILTP